MVLRVKTAISIPDKLFTAADRYAKGIAQFLELHPDDYITSKLNKVHKRKEAKLNQTVSSLQFHSIEKEEW